MALRLVRIGYSRHNPTSDDFALARYNINGSLDTSFGVGGKVTTDFTIDQDRAFAIVIQPDGRIVEVGSARGDVTFYDFALARYNNDGSLDTTFGSGGKVSGGFSGNDSFRAIALQPDGKIVGAGGYEI